jgi:putative ABC transport system permease protein
MFNNYLKIAFRNIKKHKAYSFINITGLAFGMACCLFILFWVEDELSFNRFFKNSEQIYRINKKYQMGNETSYNPSTPFPMAQTAKEKYPQILDATKYFRTRALFKYENKIFNERRVCATDSCFFNIFILPFIKGNPQQAMREPNSIVITEKIAKKYFGKSDPIGKIVMLNNQKEFIISGLIQNFPPNSDLQFDMFVPITAMVRPDRNDDWGGHFAHTFVLLQKGTNIDQLENNLSHLIQEQLPEEKLWMKLQPLNKLHLYTIDGRNAGMNYVYFFSIIAIFILTIAGINFINLSTARSEKRAKEVGLRKVVGADRSQIIKQFFGESILFTIFSLVLALILTEIFQNTFNNIVGKNLDIITFNARLILSLSFIAVFTGVVSGSYPALFLSSFQPVKVLKGTISQRFQNRFFRKILVIVQFSLSIMLLIGTGIIYRQLQFIQKKDLGFSKENILYLDLNRDLRQNYDAFKNELLQRHNIAGVARTSELPTEIWSIMRGIKWQGMPTGESAAFGFAAIDFDYIEMMDIKMVQGRNFSEKFPSDSANYIFNETAIRAMGMTDPIGKIFSLSEEEKGTIIGIVKDFHFLPLNYAIEPLLLMLEPDYYGRILIKIHNENMQKSIAHIEKVWNKISPAYPFEYHFLDETFNVMYSDAIGAGKIFKYFVIVAILISCLGLLGLASFTAEQKTKEIGVRKVLGASISGIILLLTNEFVKWVAISNLIAWPIAYFAMKMWLQNFAYRINIGIGIFLLSAVLALVIAVLTVSYQSIKAAVANPVESLRYE